MIPLTVDVPMRRLPWANWGLILATVVLSLAVPYGSEERVEFVPGRDGEGPGLVLTEVVQDIGQDEEVGGHLGEGVVADFREADDVGGELPQAEGLPVAAEDVADQLALDLLGRG
jgi:hypothetical protein